MGVPQAMLGVGQSSKVPRLQPTPLHDVQGLGAHTWRIASKPVCSPAQVCKWVWLLTALSPEDRAATEGRTGSSRTLRRVVGARGELWGRWHFCARQCLGASRASAAGGFRRNFFSTYLSLIQASLSCLDRADVSLHHWLRLPGQAGLPPPHLGLLAVGFLLPRPSHWAS